MSSKKSKCLYDYLKLMTGRVLLTVFFGISFLMSTKIICDILIQKTQDITFENLNGIINMILLLVSNSMTYYFTKSSLENKKATEVQKRQTE